MKKSVKKRLWDKGGKLDALVHEFTIGDDPLIDLHLVRWDAMASAAHAKMLEKIGILSSKELKSLLEQLEAIKASADAGEFAIEMEQEDCHTAIESFLVEKLGDVGKKIHTGRSRNDQVLVASRLYARSALFDLVSRAKSLSEAVAKQAGQYMDLTMPGYTHFQLAMPSSVGMWLMSLSEACLATARDGLDTLEQINSSPLGVGSGFGTPLPIDREYTAELLGFSRVERNPMAVQNARGRAELKVIRTCSDLGAHLEKFAWDCIIFSSAEYGFLSIPESFTTGSSIMPNKRNPDVLELVRAKASVVRGAGQELEWVIGKLPSSYHRDFQLTKSPLIRAYQSMASMLAVTESVIGGLQFDKDRIEAAMSDELFSTYAVYRKVRDGMTFRDAYLETAKELKLPEMNFAQYAEDFAIIQGGLKAEFTSAKNELQELGKSLNLLEQSFGKVESEIFSISG